MATFTPKKLAFTLLSDTPTVVYYPITEMGEIHNIILHNTNTTDEVVTVLMDDGSVELQLYKITILPDETKHLTFPSEGFIVDTSSYISMSSTTADVVTCYIIGTGRS